MSATTRPAMSRVERAAETLGRALQAEAERIRADESMPHQSRHVAAQELEHLAIHISDVPVRVAANRRARP